jgi:hypothetical protein
MRPPKISKMAAVGAGLRAEGGHRAARLHPDELEEIAALLADKLAGEMRVPAREALLRVDEVVAARPGLKRSRLYADADEFGAIRINKTKRSPLLFRLADVDAELDRRRKAPQRAAAVAAEMPALRRYAPRRGRCRTDDGAFTADGYPRRFGLSMSRAA